MGTKCDHGSDFEWKFKNSLSMIGSERDFRCKICKKIFGFGFFANEIAVTLKLFTDFKKVKGWESKLKGAEFS